MEDVLEVYQRRYGDNEVLVCEVLVCLDETSKQQVKEMRRPRPAQPGAAGSYDYEYERNRVSNLFMLFAPLEGWRRVEVTDRRIPDQSVLRREVGAWQHQRNRDAIRVDWRFTTEDARIKLKSLYPSLQYRPTTKPKPR